MFLHRAVLRKISNLSECFDSEIRIGNKTTPGRVEVVSSNYVLTYELRTNDQVKCLILQSKMLFIINISLGSPGNHIAHYISASNHSGIQNETNI